MLSQQDQQLFSLIKQTQVTRNTLISLLSAPTGLDPIFGCFVRVLVQFPTGNGEGYIIARVHSAVEGAPYSGFSQNANQSTTYQLVLMLPPSIVACNGPQFQLNTISNSSMREAEFSNWLDLMREEMPSSIPSRDELLQAITKHQTVVNGLRGNRPHNNNNNNPASSATNITTQMNDRPIAGQVNNYTGNNPPNEMNSAPNLLAASRATNIQRARRSPGASMSGGIPPFSPNHNINTNNSSTSNLGYSMPTMTNNTNNSSGQNVFNPINFSNSNVGNSNPALMRHGTLPADMLANMRNSGSNQSGTSPTNNDEEKEYQQRLRQAVFNHLNNDNVLFPKPETAKTYKLSQLRIIERDMSEYLQNVREAIADSQETCVICLVRLPTVITMPCMHKVVCKNCAYQEKTCSMCRSVIEEMFEPQEI